MPKSQAIDQEATAKQGFLLIDKPAGMTSHDVVDRVRRLTGERRVGHAGTLDPFATGLLIVGVGRVATREMQKLVGLDKEYEAVFVLGKSSTTDDVEGTIVDAPLHNHPTITTPSPSLKRRGIEEKEGGLRKTVKQFIGEIDQVPPTYSAIKIGGKKMYEAAREGKPMEGKPRKVTIYDFHVVSSRPSEASGGIPNDSRSLGSAVGLARDDTNKRLKLNVKIKCSSGTYIRSLARDLGRALGGGGYVEQLRRTSIGPFSLKDAIALDGSRGLKPTSERRLKPATTTHEMTLIPVPTFLAKL
ncbi:MAG: tRNA pseudouridine(55) synthase TruB [Patescibacteria group bacterium]